MVGTFPATFWGEYLASKLVLVPEDKQMLKDVSTTALYVMACRLKIADCDTQYLTYVPLSNMKF